MEMEQFDILSKTENVFVASEKLNFIIENKIISTYLGTETDKELFTRYFFATKS